MKIALVGGTGDIGTGFAVRWGQKHEIIIGSRNVDKARESAAAALQLLEAVGNVRARTTPVPLLRLMWSCYACPMSIWLLLQQVC
ncbi:MAG: NAD(P)-binding domain-containing protein [Methanothrix sp.]